ncbi:hypothetical protein ACQ86G_26820 [Roseateles chitinivorans]|uniref:hypothetical protein n=1 Tax=Roseateles chitinivorans TaxID=2917965 RepID=UPI003D66A3F9
MQSPAVAKAAVALLAACPPSLIPQWVQDANTVAGLIGFAITIVVWWQVRSVRLSFQAKARLPGLADAIGAARKTLGALKAAETGVLQTSLALDWK